MKVVEFGGQSFQGLPKILILLSLLCQFPLKVVNHFALHSHFRNPFIGVCQLIC